MGKRLEQQNTVEALNGDRNALLSLLLFFNKNLNPRKNEGRKNIEKVMKLLLLLLFLLLLLHAAERDRNHFVAT